MYEIVYISFQHELATVYDYNFQKLIMELQIKSIHQISMCIFVKMCTVTVRLHDNIIIVPMFTIVKCCGHINMSWLP